MWKPALTLAVLLLPFRASAIDTIPTPFPEATFYNDAFAGLGFGNYDRALGNFTKSGLTWNGRITFNEAKYGFIGVELNYHGMVNGIRDAILPNGVNPGGTTITQNVITLNFKLTKPFKFGERRAVEVYAVAGGGYVHFSTESLFSVDNTKVDNAAAFPLGAGVSLVIKSIILDARGAYEFYTGERASNIPTGNAWQAMFSIGYRIYPWF